MSFADSGKMANSARTLPCLQVELFLRQKEGVLESKSLMKGQEDPEKKEKEHTAF
jgi:hypothetical protein